MTAAPQKPLEVILAEFPSVVVGFSGGVDSALLAVVATRTLGRERAVAALGVSPSLSQAQTDQAVAVAEQFELNLVTVTTNEFSVDEYAANPVDRCYFCKRELWARLGALARERGIAAVLDGTNADDLGEHRPGLRAADELGVRSPLAEAGYTKALVRSAARAAGLPIWDAPAAPCLSSRIMYGLSVNPHRVRQVEHGEAYLRGIGIAGDLRLRHRGSEARIEVGPNQFQRVRERGKAISEFLCGLGFRTVTLDLAGYRRGSQLGGAPAELEVLAAGD